MLQIVNRINELTKAYAGMKVPVKVIVDTDTKDFEVEIGTRPHLPSSSRRLGIEKGSGSPKAEKAGNLTVEQVAKIAMMKLPGSYALSSTTAAKEILGTCVSMGITVDGRT